MFERISERLFSYLTGKRLIILFLLVAVALQCWPFSIVQTGYRGVVTKFGAITQIENEGLVTLWPWESLKTFSIRSETVKVDQAEGATVDTQPVHTSLAVRYAPRVDQVGMIYEKFSHTGDLNDLVTTATQEAFKAVTARYTATNLLAQRQKVSQDIMAALQTKLDIYGASVINIDMTAFAFSASYMAAINAKVTQEQEKQVQDNKLLTVTSQERQKVVVAEAERDAAKAHADGVAYSNYTIAEAQARALHVQAEAVSNNPAVLELKRIEVQLVRSQRWDGKTPVNVYAGAPIPFLDANPVTTK